MIEFLIDLIEEILGEVTETSIELSCSKNTPDWIRAIAIIIIICLFVGVLALIMW